MVLKINLYNQKAETIGEQKLNEKIFGVKAKEALIHQAMVTQMSNERQVLAHTKDRSEVRGGGRKPWNQKGTGRARAGSNRSPIWIGGGVTFGPRKNRNYKKNINKKMKQKALLMVLSDKVNQKTMVVVDELVVKEFKTKAMGKVLDVLEKKVLLPIEKGKKAGSVKRSILVINEQPDEKAKYSLRNLAGVKIINLDNINILDLLSYRNLLTTTAAIKKLEEKYTK